MGVGAGIACYKVPELVRRLRDRGTEVRVVMTRGAQAFVGPLTFQAVSGHPVRTTLLDEAAESGMSHIELARWADQVVVAPATADLLARLTVGLADDLLTTLCLATTAPVTLAPAMNRQMWDHPATRENVARLEARGMLRIGPDDGAQACGETGAGRMSEPATIAAAVLDRWQEGVGGGPAGPPDGLAGRRVLVTAGPTFEPVDPVRFLGNRSSGKMGFAVAQALAEAGAAVCLVAGPVRLATPVGVRERVDVTTALEMHRAVMERIDGCDVFVGAAAVADFRPAECSEQKIKKGDHQRLTLDLVRNPDILGEVAALAHRPFTVGFAAETTEVEAQARAKLQRKELDLIAANPVGRCETGFDSDDNQLTLIDRQGGCRRLAKASKLALARQLVRAMVERLE